MQKPIWLGIDLASGPDSTGYFVPPVQPLPLAAIPAPEAVRVQKERRWQELRERIMTGQAVVLFI